MSDLIYLHKVARQIYDHALASVDPRKAVREAVKCVNSNLTIANQQIKASGDVYVIAVGKAATTMALGLQDTLGKLITFGLISDSGTSPELFSASQWSVFDGGHPLPNDASLAAGRASLDLLARANTEGTVVIFLVSGGGSAMIELPVSADITLDDLRSANKTLTSCGAKIHEINAVRRSFSAIKGGGLASRVPRATLFTLIVSDTNYGDEASVASGPTLSPAPNSPDALEVIAEYRLESELPKSIVLALKRTVEKDSFALGEHYVLLSNQSAVNAAASRASSLGFSVSLQPEISEQPVVEGCRLLFGSEFGEDSCLISGGEFSCPVRGNGRGGRNLETVLRCAQILHQQDSRGHCVVLSAGTDGIDGNSTAAGAIADETTIERSRSTGLNAEEFLLRSDSYSFFEHLGDLIGTGPTGTNVRDLRLVLRSKLRDTTNQIARLDSGTPKRI